MRTGSDAGDSSVMSAADTAVASQSTTMAAQNLAPDGPAPAESLVGATLMGRYEVTRKIGQGGMGAVYEATHTLIGKRVAVKVLLDKYAQKSPIVARLEQEARLASSIGHEHIIDITDFGQTGDGKTFVVMEYLEGESLHECIAREGPLPEARVVRIARQIASALGAAHKKGVIHRDVKPENVFLLRRSDQDFVKVVDFGISKSLRASQDGSDSPRLTQTGMVLGTPLYMSPEQARGDEELDHRIDVYAVGVIMYEMVTGDVPFRGTNYLNIISQVLNEEPRRPRELRPDISEELEAVILRAMEKDAAYRYGSMDEIAADLAGLSEGATPTGSRPRLTLARLRRRQAPGRKRRRGIGLLAWVGGVAIISSAVAVTVTTTMTSKKPAAAEVEPALAPPPVPEPTPPVAEPTEPAVEVIEIPIVTEPPGATIYAGGRAIGQAPVPYKAVLENKEHVLTAELEGYETSTFSVNPAVHDADQDGPVRVRLLEVKEPTPGRPNRRPPRPAVRGDRAEPPAPATRGNRRDDTAGGELTGNPYK